MSFVQFTIHGSNGLVRVDPTRPHLCTLVDTAIAPGVRFRIPRFSCSSFDRHSDYLRYNQLCLIYDLHRTYFPRLPLPDAVHVTQAFIRTVFLPADAYHRCPEGHFATVTVSDIELLFGMSMPDESIILESFEEAQTRPVTKPASKKVVRELVMAQAEEEAGWITADHDCVIYMEEMADHGRALKLPCRHGFHKACLLRWFKTHHVCPLCRHKMPTDD